jgi:hypothetical protein
MASPRLPPRSVLDLSCQVTDSATARPLPASISGPTPRRVRKRFPISHEGREGNAGSEASWMRTKRLCSGCFRKVCLRGLRAFVVSYPGIQGSHRRLATPPGLAKRAPSPSTPPSPCPSIPPRPAPVSVGALRDFALPTPRRHGATNGSMRSHGTAGKGPGFPRGDLR